MDTTTEDPQVAYIVEAPVVGWLHLPSLHKKLLPLAQAAGYDTLTLTCECRGEDASDYTYEASAWSRTGRFRSYVAYLHPEGGYSWHDFERVLTAKLTQDQSFLATKATLHDVLTNR
jgi:hypothetical protein